MEFPKDQYLGHCFLCCTLTILLKPDTKIYSIINGVSDVEELQCDLDGMQEWSRTWLLSLNLDKCKVMHIGKTPNASYKMGISSYLSGFL